MTNHHFKALEVMYSKLPPKPMGMTHDSKLTTHDINNQRFPVDLEMCSFWSINLDSLSQWTLKKKV